MAIDITMSEQHLITMKALGRQFKLGEFYDNCNDHILAGNKLCWNSLQLQYPTIQVGHMFKLELHSNSNSVRGVKHHANKCEQMELNNHLIVSTWIGLINKCLGASNYLTEHPNPMEVTHTLIVRATSREERINLTALSRNKESLPSFSAERFEENGTHVVVSISSGAESYCVLIQEIDDDSNRENAENNLTLVATKIKNALAEKINSLDFKFLLNKEERKIIHHIKCRLYSDLQSEPVRVCSVIAAYDHCFNLIDRIQNIENNMAFPIFVHLYPLQVIVDQLDEGEIFGGLFKSRDIDADIVQKCARLLADWERVETKIDTLLMSVIKPYRASVCQFAEIFMEFQKLCKTSLRTEIKKARKSNDIEIQNMITIAENHQLFGTNRLEHWLCLKLRDSELLNRILTNVNGVTFLASREQLEDELGVSMQKNWSLVLNVPQFGEITDEILRSMTNYLATCKKLTEVNSCDEDDQSLWYTYNEKRKQVVVKVRQLLEHVKRNCYDDDRFQFFITVNENVEELGYYYSVYQGNKLKKANLEYLPSPPTGLRVHFTSSAYAEASEIFPFIFVEWEYEDIGIPCYFIVQHREKNSQDSERWIQQKTSRQGQNWFNVKMDSSWNISSVIEFRVATYTCIGRSSYCETVIMKSADVYHRNNFELPIKRKNPEAGTLQPVKMIRKSLSPASYLTVNLITQETAELEWSPLLDIPFKFFYQIQYHEDGKFFKLDVNSKEISCRLLDLQPGTTYSVSIVAVSGNGQVISQPSESLKFTTIRKESRIAQMILKDCKKINNFNEMELFLVPLVKITTSIQTETTFQRFNVGQANQQNISLPVKTILLLGARGCGKSTLINGMINYIFNVLWEDPFRFQLIEDKEFILPDPDETGSLYSRLKTFFVYHTEGFRIPFSLQIIDVPCFDDSVNGDGILDVIFQLDQNGIKKLDLICLVAQASKSTPSDIQLFQSILSNFGKDVNLNVRYLLTFGDNQVPHVLNSIAEAGLPCLMDLDSGIPLHHNFTNSRLLYSNHEAVSESDVDTRENNNLFWLKDMKSFKSFFSLLETVESKSLSLSNQVLDVKKQLNLKVNGLAALIINCQSKMEELSQKKLAAVFPVEIEENNLETSYLVKMKLPDGEFSNICEDCLFTCHYPCASYVNHLLNSCEAMDHSMSRNSRTCRVCPKKCHWKKHSLRPYKVKYVKRNKFSSDVNDSTELSKSIVQEEVRKLQIEVEEKEKTVIEEIQSITGHIQLLEKIALLPNPISILQYIDQLIAMEHQEKKFGFESRINILIRLYDKAKN